MAAKHIEISLISCPAKKFQCFVILKVLIFFAFLAFMSDRKHSNFYFFLNFQMFFLNIIFLHPPQLFLTPEYYFAFLVAGFHSFSFFRTKILPFFSSCSFFVGWKFFENVTKTFSHADWECHSFTLQLLRSLNSD